MPPPIITLLTDFGSSDPYVGIMKGVILGINPQARIVDLSHDIPPQDIRKAAYFLKTAVPYFPEGSIHLAVVDPGVGGTRKPIAVRTPKAIFVGPDNGLFSYIYSDIHSVTVYEISNPEYRLKEVSPTFEGRDVFAPAAAWISKGLPLEKMGAKVNRPVRFEIPSARPSGKNGILGEVVHADGFGNLITNISRQDLGPWLLDGEELGIEIKGRAIRGLKRFYGEALQGDVSALINSDDFLEIFIPGASAEKVLGASVGDGVEVR